MNGYKPCALINISKSTNNNCNNKRKAVFVSELRNKSIFHYATTGETFYENCF